MTAVDDHGMNKCLEESSLYLTAVEVGSRLVAQEFSPFYETGYFSRDTAILSTRPK
jgi:hypothetical protein